MSTAPKGAGPFSGGGPRGTSGREGTRGGTDGAARPDPPPSPLDLGPSAPSPRGAAPPKPSPDSPEPPFCPLPPPSPAGGASRSGPSCAPCLPTPGWPICGNKAAGGPPRQSVPEAMMHAPAAFSSNTVQVAPPGDASTQTVPSPRSAAPCWIGISSYRSAKTASIAPVGPHPGMAPSCTGISWAGTADAHTAHTAPINAARGTARREKARRVCGRIMGLRSGDRRPRLRG